MAQDRCSSTIHGYQAAMRGVSLGKTAACAGAGGGAMTCINAVAQAGLQPTLLRSGELAHSGDELGIGAPDDAGARHDATFSVQQQQRTGVVELAVGQLAVLHAEQ